MVTPRQAARSLLRTRQGCVIASAKRYKDIYIFAFERKNPELERKLKNGEIFKLQSGALIDSKTMKVIPRNDDFLLDNEVLIDSKTGKQVNDVDGSFTLPDFFEIAVDIPKEEYE